MAYKTHSGAVRQAQRLANADGAPRVVVDDGSSGGGCVKFHIVADLVGLARFYEQRAEGQPRAVTVVQPQAREGAHKTTPTRATPTNRTWQRVYRVIPEVTEVIEWETDGKEGIVAMRKATVLFVVLIALVPTVGCIEYAAAAIQTPTPPPGQPAKGFWVKVGGARLAGPFEGHYTCSQVAALYSRPAYNGPDGYIPSVNARCSYE